MPRTKYLILSAVLAVAFVIGVGLPLMKTQTVVMEASNGR